MTDPLGKIRIMAERVRALEEKNYLRNRFYFYFLAVAVALGAQQLSEYFPTDIYWAGFAALSLLTLVVVTMAGHMVLKALFWVGTNLTLTIFLAQSYCDVPPEMRTGDDALMMLVGFALIYILIDLLSSLYREAVSKSKFLDELYGKDKMRWLILAMTVMFAGLFVWQLSLVVLPIVRNLCVYNGLSI